MNHLITNQLSKGQRATKGSHTLPQYSQYNNNNNNNKQIFKHNKSKCLSIEYRMYMYMHFKNEIVKWQF